MSTHRASLRDRLLDRFLPYSYLHNPWRRNHPSLPLALRIVLLPLIHLGVLCGFRNIDYALVNGPRGRLTVGPGSSTLNTVFNVVSGEITIGSNTLFSNDCQVLTGIHRFHDGRRASLLQDSPIAEVPSQGRDISIGQGCFIGAGAIILGPCTIGDDVIVGAGAVVAADVPSGAFVAGIPAKVIRMHGALRDDASAALVAQAASAGD